MKQMTHGELRGSLLLLALLAAIIIAVYFFRSCGNHNHYGTPANPADNSDSLMQQEAGSRSAAESAAMLRLRFDAGRFDRRDSIRESQLHPSPTATDSTVNAKRSRRKSTTVYPSTKPKRRHSPSPSPIDRPV